MAVTKVGDRYVLDELRQRGWKLGGEQSSLEFIGNTAYVVTLTGEIWRIDDVWVRPSRVALTNRGG